LIFGWIKRHVRSHYARLPRPLQDHFIQDALGALYAKLTGPWIARTRIETYIKVEASHKVTDAYRAWARNWKLVDPTLVDGAAALAAEAAEPERELERRLVAKLERAMQRLPVFEAQVVHLHYWADLTIPEIAEELNVDWREVKLSLAKGRTLLARQ